jgi:hypothetical protein
VRDLARAGAAGLSGCAACRTAAVALGAARAHGCGPGATCHTRPRVPRTVDGVCDEPGACGTEPDRLCWGRSGVPSRTGCAGADRVCRAGPGVLGPIGCAEPDRVCWGRSGAPSRTGRAGADRVCRDRRGGRADRVCRARPGVLGPIGCAATDGVGGPIGCAGPDRVCLGDRMCRAPSDVPGPIGWDGCERACPGCTTAAVGCQGRPEPPRAAGRGPQRLPPTPARASRGPSTGCARNSAGVGRRPSGCAARKARRRPGGRAGRAACGRVRAR